MKDNIWNSYNDHDMNELNNICDDYRKFISNNKIEREVTKASIALAEEHGFVNIEEYINSYQPLRAGDKIYVNNRGKSLALFVIGEEYDTYKNNLNMTNIIDEKIKEKYPELTRGIITKGGRGNNGIYNQDLSDKITLLELGADKNTIEEVNNTIDLIGPIIGEYING